MCNPRRVMIHLRRHVEQAWRRTIEETASASDAVTETGRMTAQVDLSAEMGDAALMMLERVLSGEVEGFDAWVRDDRGRFIRELDEVVLIFDADASRLTVEARLTEGISAEARASAEACGFTVGEVMAEGLGRYYEDGWGGRTEEGARADALADAERRLDAAIQELGDRQNAEALARGQEAARRDAESAAAAGLEARRQEVRGLLRERVQITLARAEERAFHVMNRAVGEAYRQTLTRMALRSGGRIIRNERTGSVIDVEIEM